ncbi:hypothetical protein [Formosa maritima]|uniref:Lipocalin family protein n=1 Tax=Formosa maritima TaxID=2592046 RepID=A0A5D0GJE6_9FLAO|nr:hypothetical protein [Formosa maritima]TYA58920.1 hypothetical protein FVF61_01875 [Formosa maritima]
MNKLRLPQIMKDLKIVIIILFGFAILLSCSNDDENSENDIIIGKWVPIARYESNQQIELSLCDPFFYTEYYKDHTVISNRIETTQFPDECGMTISELGIVWENLGNRKYKIRHIDEQGTVFTIYKEASNLVIESPDNITKTVLEPY